MSMMHMLHAGSQQVSPTLVVADSLSAIKHAKVKTIRDEDGIVVDYEIEEISKYGNTMTV